MSLIKLLLLIYKHPLNSTNKLSGVLKFFKWQIGSILNPHPIIYTYTENSKIIIWKGLTGATLNIYYGLAEYNDMGFLLHFLRPDDLFIDIGANVGVYTILASAEISADSISIEPIPSTYKNLKNNIIINEIQQKVTCLNIGLGSQSEKLIFTCSEDTMNHVAKENENDVIEVEVKTLDSVLNLIKSPSLIKIDVEGFETEVINGANKTLTNKDLKAIIIELNGSGQRYGYDENEINKKLTDYGFKPYTYDPQLRALKEIKSYGSHNTIYIRDIEFVKERILNARQITLGNKVVI